MKVTNIAGLNNEYKYVIMHNIKGTSYLGEH
jgi:hypothetical protein